VVCRRCSDSSRTSFNYSCRSLSRKLDDNSICRPCCRVIFASSRHDCWVYYWLSRSVARTTSRHLMHCLCWRSIVEQRISEESAVSVTRATWQKHWSAVPRVSLLRSSSAWGRCRVGRLGHGPPKIFWLYGHNAVGPTNNWPTCLILLAYEITNIMANAAFYGFSDIIMLAADRTFVDCINHHYRYHNCWFVSACLLTYYFP